MAAAIAGIVNKDRASDAYSEGVAPDCATAGPAVITGVAAATTMPNCGIARMLIVPSSLSPRRLGTL
jgi:hypothetical protein